jgi:hypothetical protein
MCENIIKMKRATFWVLVFAKTQKPQLGRAKGSWLEGDWRG